MDDVDPRPDVEPGEGVPAKPLGEPQVDPAVKLNGNGDAAFSEPAPEPRAGARPCAECAEQAKQLEQLRAGMIVLGAAVVLVSLAVILSRAGQAATPPAGA